MVIFNHRLPSISSCLTSTVVFHHRLSSIKGCCPSKVVFPSKIHLGISSIEVCLLPWRVIFHQDCLPSMSPSIKILIGTNVRRSSRSAFGGPTGNNVSGHYKWHYLFFFFFLCCLLFSKKECLDLKTYLAKVDGNAQKPRGRPLSRPSRPFWGPLAAILDFWCSHRRNDRIKKLFFAKVDRSTK